MYSLCWQIPISTTLFYTADPLLSVSLCYRCLIVGYADAPYLMTAMTFALTPQLTQWREALFPDAFPPPVSFWVFHTLQRRSLDKHTSAYLLAPLLTAHRVIPPLYLARKLSYSSPISWTNPSCKTAIACIHSSYHRSHSSLDTKLQVESHVPRKATTSTASFENALAKSNLNGQFSLYRCSSLVCPRRWVNLNTTKVPF